MALYMVFVASHDMRKLAWTFSRTLPLAAAASMAFSIVSFVVRSRRLVPKHYLSIFDNIEEQ